MAESLTQSKIHFSDQCFVLVTDGLIKTYYWIGIGWDIQIHKAVMYKTREIAESNIPYILEVANSYGAVYSLPLRLIVPTEENNPAIKEYGRVIEVK